jgi:site-specific DNA-methyltransferase (adenine-specific)
MREWMNQVLCGDCVELLRRAKEPFADLVFADPPFNIGYKYDKYHDKRASEKYLAWSRDWIGACAGVLKPHGSFYIAIGDEYAAQIKLIMEDELGLTLRNWIIWHYTFGQQTRNKFARSHTHILYFVKDAKSFTFNDGMVRVISDRQKKYADRRANPAGKMPDDVWDEYPRVCGTFRERTSFPCQMPESLLARIIRVSSNEGDWVLDPFCGSGTTAVVAHKLNRKFTTIDISKEYVEAARERVAQSEGLASIEPALVPDGTAKTAVLRKGETPSPQSGERGRGPQSRRIAIGNPGSPYEEGLPEWPEHADAELRWLYSENKVPLRQLCANRMLLTLLTAKLNARLQKARHYAPEEVNERLDLLDGSGKLSPLDKTSGPQMGALVLED